MTLGRTRTHLPMCSTGPERQGRVDLMSGKERALRVRERSMPREPQTGEEGRAHWLDISQLQASTKVNLRQRQRVVDLDPEISDRAIVILFSWVAVPLQN